MKNTIYTNEIEMREVGCYVEIEIGGNIYRIHETDFYAAAEKARYYNPDTANETEKEVEIERIGKLEGKIEELTDRLDEIGCIGGELMEQINLHTDEGEDPPTIAELLSCLEKIRMQVDGE